MITDDNVSKLIIEIIAIGCNAGQIEVCDAILERINLYNEKPPGSWHGNPRKWEDEMEEVKAEIKAKGGI